MTTEARAVEAALDRWIARTDRALNQDLIDVMADAADGIRSLSARIERLEEALKPLAALKVPTKPEGNAGFYSIRFSDIEAAQSAITASSSVAGRKAENMAQTEREAWERGVADMQREIERLRSVPARTIAIEEAAAILDLWKSAAEAQAVKWAFGQIAEEIRRLSAAPSDRDALTKAEWKDIATIMRYGSPSHQDWLSAILATGDIAAISRALSGRSNVPLKTASSTGGDQP